MNKTVRTYLFSLTFILAFISCTNKKEVSTTNNTGAGSDSSTAAFSSEVSKSSLASAAIDPSKIKEISFWLQASALNLKEGAEVTSWVDSKSGIAFSAGTKAPTFSKTKLNGHPAVVFNQSPLESKEVNLSELLDEDSFSLFAVAQLATKSNYDLFGTNNCGQTRFLMHFPNSQILHFQMGNPGDGAFSIPAPTLTSPEPVVVGVNKNGSNVTFTVFGYKQVTSKNFKSNANFLGRNLFIGSSGCQNGYTGAVAEIIFSKKSLSETNFEGVGKFLVDKYNVSFK